jgi:hypothetical protein
MGGPGVRPCPSKLPCPEGHVTPLSVPLQAPTSTHRMMLQSSQPINPPTHLLNIAQNPTWSITNSKTYNVFPNRWSKSIPLIFGANNTMYILWSWVHPTRFVLVLSFMSAITWCYPSLFTSCLNFFSFPSYNNLGLDLEFNILGAMQRVIQFPLNMLVNDPFDTIPSHLSLLFPHRCFNATTSRRINNA